MSFSGQEKGQIKTPNRTSPSI